MGSYLNETRDLALDCKLTREERKRMRQKKVCDTLREREEEKGQLKDSERESYRMYVWVLVKERRNVCVLRP